MGKIWSVFLKNEIILGSVGIVIGAVYGDLRHHSLWVSTRASTGGRGPPLNSENTVVCHGITYANATLELPPRLGEILILKIVTNFVIIPPRRQEQTFFSSNSGGGKLAAHLSLDVDQARS